MGANRIEIVRLGNKFTSYPGLPARNEPNVLEVISMTTTGTTANQSDPVSEQAEYQDLWAIVTCPEQSYVAVGEGNAATAGRLCQANGSVMLPVRAGDVIECKDVA